MGSTAAKSISSFAPSEATQDCSLDDPSFSADTAPGTPPSPPATAPAPRGWNHPLCWYGTVLTILVLVSWQVVTHASGYDNAGPYQQFPGDSFLKGLVRWDGNWYHHIATYGYSQHADGIQSPVAFFPGYPMAMRFGGWLTGSDLLAGVLLTAAAGAGSTVLFWHWCRDRLSSGTATAAAAASVATSATLGLLLYPFSYYLYAVVYADALFLCAALAAFTALERDRPLVAGLAGAVATLTRPVGIAVVVGLAIRAMERRQVFSRPRWFGFPTRCDLRKVRRRDAPVLLSFAGLAGYAGYLWVQFGDPFLFSSVQRYWEQPSAPHTWLKLRFVGHLLIDIDNPYTWGLVVHAVFALSALVAVPFVVRRFGLGYGIYCLIVLTLPILGSKDFHGLGRYLLPAFPVFALAGLLLAERPGLRRPVLAFSGTMLVLLMAGFSHGYYLA